MIAQITRLIQFSLEAQLTLIHVWKSLIDIGVDCLLRHFECFALDFFPMMIEIEGSEGNCFNELCEALKRTLNE